MAAIDEIIRLNTHIAEFWSRADGWAPADAAELLSRARFDRQVSLSRTLRLWQPPTDAAESDGRLILAWTNLGALVEGTLKWFLCVFEHDYAKSPLVKRRGPTAGEPLEPDEPMLGELIDFYAEQVWTESERDAWTAWLDMVRTQRNAIHAYQHRDVGDWADFDRAVQRYRDLLLGLEGRAPYPDEYAYPADIAEMHARAMRRAM
jgi:hypothetical protein